MYGHSVHRLWVYSVEMNVVLLQMILNVTQIRDERAGSFTSNTLRALKRMKRFK